MLLNTFNSNKRQKIEKNQDGRLKVPTLIYMNQTHGHNKAQIYILLFNAGFLTVCSGTGLHNLIKSTQYRTIPA